MGSPPHRRERRYVLRPAVEELETRVLPSVATPAQIRHAYAYDQIRFTVNGKSVVGDGSGQTIAIVDAYNDPNIAADLDVFDKSFALNVGSSQTIYQAYGASSKFLTVAKPEGQPSTDPTGAWEMEIALDVEWAHALAPGAKILLVEAANNSFSNLLNAVNYARTQPGVSVVSMSWGVGEFAGETAYDSVFHTPAGHTGVTFLASTGDSSVAEWPALSPYVVGVGGTALNVSAAGNYLSETAWSDGGGGVSTQEKRPSFQSKVEPNQKDRTGPDVSANAAYGTAGYVYSSYPVDGQMWDWWQWGGTSAAVVQWAALVAVADQGRALAGEGTLDGATQTLPALYQLPSIDFHDITSGSNGNAAHTGYDLATGLGSPIANRVAAGLVAYGAKPTTTTSAAAGKGTAASGLTATHNLSFGAPVEAPTLPDQTPAGGEPSRTAFSPPVVIDTTTPVVVPPASSQTVAPPVAPDPVTVSPRPTERPESSAGPTGMGEAENETPMAPIEESPEPAEGPSLAAAALGAFWAGFARSRQKRKRPRADGPVD